MLTAILLAVALSVNPAPSPEDTPPPSDNHWLAAIVPRIDGFDVYSFRENQLREPVVRRLLKTAIDLDGEIAAPTQLLAAPADFYLSSGAGSPPLLYWTTEESFGRRWYVTPLSAQLPPIAGGTLLSPFAAYPSIHCDPDSCFANWSSSLGMEGAFLDRSATIVNGPFALPPFFYPYDSAAVDAGGVVLFGASADKYFVVSISRDGSVRYKTPILPWTMFTTAVFSHDGNRAVVAYLANPWPLQEKSPSVSVSALTVSDDGRAEDLGTLVAPEGARYVSGLGMAWNGTTYLLAAAYVTQDWTGRVVAVELDSQLRVVNTAEVAMANGVNAGRLNVVPNGDRFLIAWQIGPPTVTIYERGRLTTPVAIYDLQGPRRRAVSH